MLEGLQEGEMEGGRSRGERERGVYRLEVQRLSPDCTGECARCKCVGIGVGGVKRWRVREREKWNSQETIAWEDLEYPRTPISTQPGEDA